MKTLRKALALLLCAGLLPVQPSFAQPAAQAWQARLSRPGGEFSAAEGLPGPALPAFARCLDRTGLDAGETPSIGEVRTALKSLLASMQAKGPRPASPSERIEALALRRAALRDLRLSAALLEGRDRKLFIDQVSAAEAAAEREFRSESSELLNGKIAALAGKAAAWRGRTADIPLPDGSVLSLKRHKEIKDLVNEADRMQDVLSFGIEAPIPLSRADGLHSLKDPKKGDLYLPYLMPKGLVEGYRAYLNDKLPDGLSSEEKAARIEAAAIKAADHMIVLLRNGRAHSSLMPLSHHGSHWEWDFWRWNIPFLGEMRYGPSFISVWREAFAFPNIRLSGLADWEHIAPLKDFYQTHHHDDHAKGTVHHDAYSLALGQNLAELSFLLLHSGTLNGLPAVETARIIEAALKRYLAGALGSGEAASFDWDSSVRSALISSARRFKIASHPLWTAGYALLFLAAAAGAVILIASRITAEPPIFAWIVAAFPTGIMITFALGNGISPFHLPGWAIDPLLMGAVKPAVELLRRAEPLGLPALGHPSGSPWSLRQSLIFATALLSAPFLPVILASFFPFLAAQGLWALGVEVPPLAVVLPAAAAAVFAAVRVVRFLFGLLVDAVNHTGSFPQAPPTGPPAPRKPFFPLSLALAVANTLTGMFSFLHPPRRTPSDGHSPSPHLIDTVKSLGDFTPRVLTKTASEVSPGEISSPEFQRLLAGMEKKMSGAVGIAAPQVGVGKRVFLLPGLIGSLALINPKLTVLDTRLRPLLEGCLSLPEELGLVYRPRKVRVDFLDRGGHFQSRIFTGFWATVVQHEIDHLDGVLFPMRMRSYPKRFGLGKMAKLAETASLEYSKFLASLDPESRERLRSRRKEISRHFHDALEPGTPACELRKAPGVDGFAGAFLEALAWHRARVCGGSVPEKARRLAGWIRSPNHALFAYEDLSSDPSPEAAELLSILGAAVPAMAVFQSSP
jgi:peptide deformylase